MTPRYAVIKHQGYKVLRTVLQCSIIHHLKAPMCHDTFSISTALGDSSCKRSVSCVRYLKWELFTHLQSGEKKCRIKLLITC